MRIVCAWCSKELSAFPGDDGMVSHGMCLLCKRDFTGETWLSLKEAVGRIPFPVLLVDRELKVEAVSAPAATLVGNDADEKEKQLTGVVIGCANSRLPGGCGHSSQCVGCILRNTATATFVDGRTRNAVTTAHKLLTDGSERAVNITFSAERISGSVLIYVEDIRDHPAATESNQACA
jgi:hypothetical protein